MREPGNKVPTEISPEAWEAAMSLDQCIDEFIVGHGMKRNEGFSQMHVVMAKMVQLAINKAFEKANA